MTRKSILPQYRIKLLLFVFIRDFRVSVMQFSELESTKKINTESVIWLSPDAPKISTFRKLISVSP